MRRSTQAVVSVAVGALVAAIVYTWLWASVGLVVGLVVTYGFGAWAFIDGYGDWPATDAMDRVQVAFPVFAMTATLFGVPMSLPVHRRIAIGILVFGAAYGGILLGVAAVLRATHDDATSERADD